MHRVNAVHDTMQVESPKTGELPDNWTELTSTFLSQWVGIPIHDHEGGRMDGGFYETPQFPGGETSRFFHSASNRNQDDQNRLLLRSTTIITGFILMMLI